MEEEEGGGMKLSKRFSDKGGEVDYKTKAGTAWSHSYLNQKPWHPLSYPNQRRKWIAEQTDAQKLRRADEVAREFAQEQEFFRQTALVSKKEKEKVEMMKAVSFMYVRPPGYNPESAKAAEIADERKTEEHIDPSQDQPTDGPSTSMPSQSRDHAVEEKKKPRPRDVFGRALPTEEEFEVLKNAPRLETGVAGRAKPFGVEVRNVKCVRCGTFGHQSGDRECPLKDAIMPNEESRLKRDDPLTAILAHTDASEPLKWELKQKPGISPPRGGFKQDDPNQQIVAEDIFDEYGGFLSGGIIPELLTNFTSSKPKKKKSTRKSKHKRQSSPTYESKAPEEEWPSSSDDGERRSERKEKKHTKKKRNHSKSYVDDSENDRHDHKKSKHKHSYSISSESFESDGERISERKEKKHAKMKRNHSKSYDDDSENDRHDHKKSKHKHSYSSSSESSESDGERRSERKEKKHAKTKRNYSKSYDDDDSENDRYDPKKSKHKHSYSSSSESSESDGRYRSKHHHNHHHHRHRHECRHHHKPKRHR